MYFATLRCTFPHFAKFKLLENTNHKTYVGHLVVCFGLGDSKQRSQGRRHYRIASKNNKIYKGTIHKCPRLGHPVTLLLFHKQMLPSLDVEDNPLLLLLSLSNYCGGSHLLSTLQKNSILSNTIRVYILTNALILVNLHILK